MFNAQHPSEFIVEEIMPDGTVLELGKRYGPAQASLKVDTGRLDKEEGTDSTSGPAKAEEKDLAESVVQMGKPEDQGLERDYFTHFVLQKTDWNTMQALDALAFQMHVKPGRFNFAGTKDKRAITVQRCSAFAMAPSRILPAKIKDIVILGAWKAKDKVKLGQLAGNRFTITLTEANCGKSVTAEQMQKRAEQIGFKIKNYFGRQRFGSLRQNTAIVGGLMLSGDFEGAAWEYIAGEGPEPENFAQARAKLRTEKDFAAAIQYFPGPLKYEKAIISHLAVQPTDFVGALRALPPNLQLMLVHAYQSQLFNEFIAENDGDYACPTDELGFPDEKDAVLIGGLETGAKPDVGAASNVNDAATSTKWPCAHIIGYDTFMTERETAFLDKKGLKPAFFNVKSMPNLSVKGTLRPTQVPLKDFSAEDKVLEDGTKAAVVRFSLPAGSYATVALDQLLD
ncbi:tRNA pseudouridine(13) synthase TruD [Candidatus Micrarchaeota archaeon]|nr:tRNA pseudouridine(13) synthase TruD [Candidatus Micrarchaeota archaeon]